MVQIFGAMSLTEDQVSSVVDLARETSAITGANCNDTREHFVIKPGSSRVQILAHATEHIGCDIATACLYEAGVPHWMTGRAGGWNKNAPQVRILDHSEVGIPEGAFTEVMEIAVGCVNEVLNEK